MPAAIIDFLLFPIELVLVLVVGVWGWFHYPGTEEGVRQAEKDLGNKTVWQMIRFISRKYIGK